MPTTQYVWNIRHDSYLMEKDGTEATKAVYTNESRPYGQRISQHRDGQTSYYRYHGQGSTQQLTDKNGNVTDTATCTAFGEEVEKTGTTENPFGHKGAARYHSDPGTNSVYVRQREYAPQVGRWLSHDPLTWSDPLGHGFRYAANLALQYSDPTGLCFVCRWDLLWSGDDLAALDKQPREDTEPITEVTTSPKSITLTQGGGWNLYD